MFCVRLPQTADVPFCALPSVLTAMKWILSEGEDVPELERERHVIERAEQLANAHVARAGKRSHVKNLYILSRLVEAVPDATTWTFCCMHKHTEYQGVLVRNNGQRDMWKIRCSEHEPINFTRRTGCMGATAYSLTTFLERHGGMFPCASDVGALFTNV